MKSFTRLSVCVAVAATALFAAGCPKKPLRPNPSQTMIGGGDGGFLDPSLVPADAGINVEPRGDDEFANVDFTQFQPVFFGFDSAAIGAAERSKVEAAASYLRSNPGARLLLVGRCDWRGTSEYNLGLGDRRGRSVKDFMATFGVSAASVEVISKGDIDAQEGANEAGMQQDRRVDIGIMR